MTHISEMLRTHPRASSASLPGLQECIEACYDCAQSCNSCVRTPAWVNNPSRNSSGASA